jgi:hypothetical protein
MVKIDGGKTQASAQNLSDLLEVNTLLQSLLSLITVGNQHPIK